MKEKLLMGVLVVFGLAAMIVMAKMGAQSWEHFLNKPKQQVLNR
jgi:hypothetical protein